MNASWSGWRSVRLTAKFMNRTASSLDEMNAESEFDLLGLFQGTGVPFRSHDDIALLPNMVWLYRRPILDYWAEHEEALGNVVRHVLIHEIGHHFGLSDDDMAEIEADARGGNGDGSRDGSRDRNRISLYRTQYSR